MRIIGVDGLGGNLIDPAVNPTASFCPGLSCASHEVAIPLRGNFKIVLYLTMATNSSTDRELRCIVKGDQLPAAIFAWFEMLTLAEDAIENCLGRISGKGSVMYSIGITADLNSVKTSAIVRLGLFA